MMKNGGQNEEIGGQQREKGRDQPALAGARVLRICCGRRSGRLAGHEFLGMAPPILQELLGAEEQCGTGTVFYHYWGE